MSYSSTAATDHDAGSGRRSRILIVEDDFLCAMAAEAALAAAGFDVVGIAGDGVTAVALAAAGAPDLALMDVRLRGDMSGLEVAAELRRRFDLPCLFVSSNLDPWTRAQAAAARPVGFVDKPYSEAQLLAAVRAALAAAGTAPAFGSAEAPALPL